MPNGLACRPSQVRPRRIRMGPPPNHNPNRRRTGGFTIVEAALATVIVSTGVLAILGAQQAYHRKNNWAQRSGTGMLLANELRELTLTLPMHDPITATQNMGAEADEIEVGDYDDLDDFAGPVTNGFGAGIVFSPPINASRQPIDDLDGWTQRIDVYNVLPGNISVSDGLTQPLGTTDMMRAKVTVTYQGPLDGQPVTMTVLTWVVGRE